MTLIIKDLALDKALDGKTMAAVRGGLKIGSTSRRESSRIGLFAPVSVANGD